MAVFGELMAELRQDRGLTQKSWERSCLSPPGPFPTMKTAYITQIWKNWSNWQIIFR